MAEFESDNFFDGDWEDKGDLAWNEFDWALYLGRCDTEVARFQKIYQQLEHHPERMDEAARSMGWDREDWSANPDESEGESETFSRPKIEFSLNSDEAGEVAPEDDGDPYSAQKHPVFVVTRALCRDIESLHRTVICRPDVQIPADLAWDAASANRDLELQVALAVNTLDLGDFALGICYFKHGFKALNRMFSTTNRINEFLPENLAPTFIRAVSMRLFDIREVWLRVINECRDENADYGEGENS